MTAHQELREVHARVAGVYDLWDSTYYDYDKDGEGCTRFHPADLPPTRMLQPLSEMATFGGFGPELLELLRGAAEFKMNKLSAAEYDETTWSARTWLTFAMQRISVAVHKAVAKELSDALGFSGAVDPRGAPRD